MAVLVLGARGMLGSDVVAALGPERAVASDADSLDITDRAAVAARIAELAPRAVINCAAYTAVARAEQEEAEAWRINAEGPRHLVEACARGGIPLVHVSTDYVFDGRDPAGYREDAPRNPINAYGRTKAAGEEAVERYERSWLVRTSWLFGRRGPNFVDTMLRLGREREEIAVVDDQVGCPSYTSDVASRLVDFLDWRLPWGTYHVTNEGRCTWHAFAVEIMRRADLACRVVPISTERYGDPTPRPRNSVLVNTKLPPLRSWQAALAAYL
jgi:dTDP-4-dehydrorhamnose reductase